MSRKILYLLGLSVISFSCDNNNVLEPLSLSAETESLDGGLSIQLTVKQDNSEIPHDEVSWFCSDPSLATVSETGVVTAICKATVTLTAVLKNDPTTQGTLNLLITQNHFVTTWTGEQITIPTEERETYDYNVDWDNDGVFDSFSLSGPVTHTFESDGEHTIRIEGIFPAIHFVEGGDLTPETEENASKIIFVDQWGTGEWLSMEEAFEYCKNLDVRATDAPNLSKVKSMGYMFVGTNLTYPDFSSWDT